MPSKMAALPPRTVLDTYDLIGFDPRGVGHSTPQSCKLSSVNYAAAFPYPDADGSIQRNVDAGRRIANECKSADADLPHFTTANTARDLDRVRQALGVPNISYWGQSCGTYLSAAYASLLRPDGPRGQRGPEQGVTGTAAGLEPGHGRPVSRRREGRRGERRGTGPRADGSAGHPDLSPFADRLERTPAQIPGTQISIDGVLLRGVTYQLLLRNETLPLLTRFWKAAATLATGGEQTEVDVTVLQQIFAGTPRRAGRAHRQPDQHAPGTGLRRRHLDA